MRKIKRESSKYKGKLPLNFFNYGRVGFFFAKFPYGKREDNDDEENNDK